MSRLIIATGLTGAIAVAATALHVGSTKLSQLPDDSGVVVITGTGSAKPYPPSAPPSPLLELVTASDVPPKAPMKRATSFTASEQEELSKMDSNMREEVRDDAWASSNEQRFKSRLQNMGIFSNSKTNVACGATTCVLSAQTDPNQTSYNIESALEAFSQIGLSENFSQKLQTSKLYTMKGKSSETVFKVELIRNE